MKPGEKISELLKLIELAREKELTSLEVTLFKDVVKLAQQSKSSLYQLFKKQLDILEGDTSGLSG